LSKVSRKTSDKAPDDKATSALANQGNPFAFSRPLDVHRWSDFPEADRFVDQVYSTYFNGKDSKQIERKHVKVILLDLYVAWLEHPDLKIAVSMRPSTYKSKGNRYNALRISKKTIEVVDDLIAAGLIEQKRGSYNRQLKSGWITRIWPTPELVTLFRQSNLDVYKVGRTPDEEVIILRNDEREDIEYEDTAETVEMRELVQTYNKVLSLHWIDIRRLEDPWIELKDGTKLIIGRHRQQVKRIFNRSSFSKGGRFFGPWWQQCPKEWRRQIFIDDAPTVEQDYSSLHVGLLYARRGVNYYESFEGDAYQVDTPPFLSSPEQTRKYAKLLLLMAVNAKSDKEAYAAFRNDRNERRDKLGGSLTNDQLSVLLDGLKSKHPLIAEDLGSDAGIDLMNQDARMTEHVIRRFTEQGTPVLTVHDSYIVKFGYEKFLDEVLAEAYTMLTGQEGIKSTVTGVAMNNPQSWHTQKPPEGSMIRCGGYERREIDWCCYLNEVKYGHLGPMPEVGWVPKGD